MNNSMDIEKKIDYIEQDFEKNMKNKLGRMPEVKEEAIKWYSAYMKLETKWCEKYEKNSLKRYAFSLAALFRDRNERIYRERFGTFGNVDCLKVGDRNVSI